MLTVENIPQEWKDVLSRVQELFPSAVIAGGSLRDLDNNKAIKDVDIFIPVTADDFLLAERIYDVHPTVELHKSSSYDIMVNLGSDSSVTDKLPDDTDRDIHAVFRMKLEYEYDLIMCSQAAADVNTFDINICQITFDGKTIHKSAAYLVGHQERVIKVMNVNRGDRNAARVARLQEKYTEYTIDRD
jgi:hypothetical protein